MPDLTHIGARLLVVVILLAGPIGTPNAIAEEGELAWSLDLGLLMSANANANGDTTARTTPTLGASLRYALTDFWELSAELRGGPGLGDRDAIEGMGLGIAELRLVIDALDWVPYLCAGVGALFRSDGPSAYRGGAGPDWDVTVHGGVGIDYRPRRDWSVGFVARYHATVTALEGSSGPIDVTLRLSFHHD